MGLPRALRQGRATVLVAISGLACFLVLGAGTEAGWQSAGIAHGTDTVKTARLSFTHTYASTTCSGTSAAVTTCPGSPAATAASTSSAQSVSDVLANSSTTTGSSAYTEQVRVSSCNPAQFADAHGGNVDPMLPRHRVTRQVTDPWGTTSAASFDGADDYAADIAGTTTAAVAGENYSVGVWFRAPGGSGGGGLLSLNADPLSNTSAGANPALYLDVAGNVRFYAVGILSLRSASTDYRDGAWHLAVATVSQAPDTVRLYVDGSQVDSVTGVLLSGTLATSYWHLGWTDTTAFPASSTSHFTGSLSGAFVIQTTLAPTAVSDLHSAGSAAAYAAALGVTGHVWMLGDSVTSTYAGTVGFVDGGDPCTEVMLAWTLGGTTAFGASAVASLEGPTWRPVTPAAAPANGANQTLTTSFENVGWPSYDADVAGMELLVPLSHRVSLTGAPGWVMQFDWPKAVLLG